MFKKKRIDGDVVWTVWLKISVISEKSSLWSMMHFFKKKRMSFPASFPLQGECKISVVALKISKSRMFIYILKIELSILAFYKLF